MTMPGFPIVAVHTARIGVRIPVEVRDRAERHAAEMGLSLSDFIRLVLDLATAEPEPQEEPKLAPTKVYKVPELLQAAPARRPLRRPRPRRPGT